MNATGLVRWPDATRRRFPLVVIGCLGLLVALTTAARAAVPHSVVTRDKAALIGVSAVSARNGWAVGGSPAGKPVILHWNGTDWKPTVVPTSAARGLAAVSALSRTDAWTVGFAAKQGVAVTLALHWNGSRWARTPTPSPGQGSALSAVSAQSAADVWAVGDAPGTSATSIVPLALHWNGTRWAKKPMPSPANVTSSGITSVSADSPSDAWAVGSSDTASNTIVSLIEHWNGSRWTVVPSPDPGRSIINLYGVSALSSTDVWAVGSYVVSATQETLVLHWNGSNWTQVPSPSVGQSSVLNSVTAISPSNAWAVGSGGSGTVVLHWNGSTWAQVASPSPGGDNGTLASVSAVSPANVWAVGTNFTGSKTGGEITIILHWNGRSWVRS